MFDPLKNSEDIWFLMFSGGSKGNVGKMVSSLRFQTYPANIYLFKVNNLEKGVKYVQS